MEFLFLMVIASMSISMSSAVCFGVPHMLVGTSVTVDESPREEEGSEDEE